MYSVFRKNGVLFLIAFFLILCIGCSPDLSAQGTAVSLEQGTEDVSPSLTPTASPSQCPTFTPSPSPEPTPSPVPDPLIQVWSDESGVFSLVLKENGSYESNFKDRLASGSFTAEDGLLNFTSSDGVQSTIPYSCDGSTITLYQREQSSLSLKADDASAFLIDPNAPGSLPEFTEDAAPRISYAYANKGVVTVELAPECSAKDYCFTCLNVAPPEKAYDWLPIEGSVFRTFKYDGSYYIFVRDAQGRISDPYPLTVQSGYRYPIRAEGLSALRMPLTELAEKNGTTVEEMNETMATDIAWAGVYTRMGAVTSAVSAVSHMAELGYTIPYQGLGKYQAKDEWGYNPAWGAKLPYPTKDGNGKYYYTGMQCVGSIVWALKQAGLDISNAATGWQIGRLGEVRRYNDNKIKHYQLKSGDFIQVNQHYEMVVDRVDTNADGTADSFLLYEMESPHLSFLILTFRNVQGREHFNMDAVYNNQGRLNVKNRIWQGTSWIPYEELPSWLKQANEKADEKRALDRLMRTLGILSNDENAVID